MATAATAATDAPAPMAPGRSARQTSLYRAVWRASRSVWVDPYTARVTGSKGRNDIVQISSPLLALGAPCP